MADGFRYEYLILRFCDDKLHRYYSIPFAWLMRLPFSFSSRWLSMSLGWQTFRMRFIFAKFTRQRLSSVMEMKVTWAFPMAYNLQKSSFSFGKVSSMQKREVAFAVDKMDLIRVSSNSFWFPVDWKWWAIPHVKIELNLLAGLSIGGTCITQDISQQKCCPGSCQNRPSRNENKLQSSL